MKLPLGVAVALMERDLQLKRASAITADTSPARARYGSRTQGYAAPENIRGLIRPNVKQIPVQVENERAVVPKAVGLFRAVYAVKARDIVVDGATSYQVAVAPDDNTSVAGYTKVFLTASAASN